MASSTHIRRVVFSHDWQDLAEWVGAIDALADFSDEEIEKLVAPSDTVASALITPCRS